MRLMLLKDVSQATGIPLETLRRAVRAQPGNPMHLPHVRLGKGQVYVKEEWLEEWLNRLRSDAVLARGHVTTADQLKAAIKRLERRKGGAV
ncbi:hypothetical protein [Thermus phage P23-77]|uniref:Helix-turn-helix domain-containing protein n=1 Tax=Thermus virus P23-77 TaxID=1714272 RepID=C8CHN3_9VIRU|nr:hypothetical protein P23-77_gp37 [Thermus phage P23-77]ACV05062.1 hypothetical protein [Thermus phage P23-77]